MSKKRKSKHVKAPTPGRFIKGHHEAPKGAGLHPDKKKSTNKKGARGRSWNGE